MLDSGAWGSDRSAMAPAVLTELLSDPELPNSAAHTLTDLPLLEIESGYWERAGRLRAPRSGEEAQGTAWGRVDCPKLYRQGHLTSDQETGISERLPIRRGCGSSLAELLVRYGSVEREGAI